MTDSEQQRPVDIILARGWMANLATPAVLVDVGGALVYFNEAAGQVLGVRFEEAASMSPQELGTRFAPFSEDGERLPFDRLPLAIALNEERPAHSRFRIHSANGRERELEVSAFPIVGSNGVRGAMAIFWVADDSR